MGKAIESSDAESLFVAFIAAAESLNSLVISIVYLLKT